MKIILPTVTALLLLSSTCLQARQSNTRNQSNVAHRNHYQRLNCATQMGFELRNGRIYGWGNNVVGQIGVGNNIQQNSPVQVGTDSNWVSIATGFIGGGGIKADGTLWTWGYNHYGELGIGSTTDQWSPVQVGSDHDWVAISEGNYFAMALKANGTLWTWGWNHHGELGQGDLVQRNVLTQVGTDNDWVSLLGGYFIACAIKADGTLWAWGLNTYGDLGIGDTLDRLSPVQVGNNDKWIGISNWGQGLMGLQSDGTIWGWGQNTNFELGLGDTTKRLAPVQIGTDRDWVRTGQGVSTAIKANGQLWGWGINTGGQLGMGNLNEPPTPMLLNNGQYWADVEAGGNTNSMYLKTDGSIWVAGGNAFGQLGLGYANAQLVDTLTATSTPAAEWVSGTTGGLHSAAIYSDGSLWTWGANTNGQLGLGNTTDQHSATQVGGTNWVAAAAGSSYTLALKGDGSLWATGKNSDGQLGLGSNTEQHSFVQVSGTWAAMAAGDVHALALKADGTLWAWGNNSEGQLGLGNYTAHNAPVQVGQDSIWIAIATGEGHSLALKSDGTLWAWGLNIYGQLGIGNNTIQNAPVQVGTDNNWTAIGAGANHSMALKADGTLWTWGQNSSGQLGLGNNSNQSSPVQVGGSNWIAMNGGANHTIAYKADGTVWSWGANGYGQLGLGNNTNYNTPQPVTEPAIVHIFTGPEANHSGLLRDTRSLICLAGNNSHGQLGDGTILDKNTFNCINECVTPGITIAVSPNDSVCSGDTVKFTATITNGGPTPGYQWFKNNVPVGQNNDLYTANPNTLSTGDVIKCVLTGSAACNLVPTDTSNVITMHVTQSVVPTITITPDIGDTICAEHIVTYTATITNGGPTPVYRWYENNVAVGTNTNTHQPALVNGNVIKCRLVSSAVCATPDTVMSSPHTLMIAPVTIPVVTVSANPSTVIAQNQSVTFTANVTNAVNPQYQWRKNAVNIPGATQQTYTSNTLQNGDVIACRVRGLSICDTAANSVTMTVWPLSVNGATGNSEQIAVYPNPVKDILLIDYSNITNGRLEICDMAGKVLIKQPLSHSVDMKGLASGAYLLRIQTITATKFTKLITKE
ncbi:MAG: T9SS type A sorting domain-containing protein [Bacteroidetes bacterium]|nr:T9SS type A sorting domain-containing protein [Bacteroidota bacterium]